MRKIVFILIFSIFATCSYAEDLAGWDKTTWGMSEKEVFALYKNRIKKVDTAKEPSIWNKAITLNNISIDDSSFFEVVLFFEKDSLIEVSLTYESTASSTFLKPPSTLFEPFPLSEEEIINLKSEFYKVKGLLVQKYGQPDTENHNKKFNAGEPEKLYHDANWFKGRTTIRLVGYAFVGKPTVSIVYKPSKKIEGL